MKKLFLNILKILLGLIIIIFLIYKVGLSNLLNIFKSLNLFYFLIAIIITIFLFIIEVLNIKILTDVLNKNINYLKMFKLYMVSWGLSLFIPGNLGQFSLVYLLNKEGLGLGEGTAIILLNKFITFISLFLLSIFGLFIFFPFKEALQIILIMLFFIFIIFLLFIHEKGRNLINKYLLRKNSLKFEGFFKTFKKFYIEYSKRLIANFFLTLVRWFLTAIMLMFLFLSLGFNVKFLYILLITPLVAIISLIPITVGGIGVRESSAVFFYNLVGVNSVAALGVYMLTFFINCTITIISIFFPLKYFKKEI